MSWSERASSTESCGTTEVRDVRAGRAGAREIHESEFQAGTLTDPLQSEKTDANMSFSVLHEEPPAPMYRKRSRLALARAFLLLVNAQNA